MPRKPTRRQAGRQAGRHPPASRRIPIRKKAGGKTLAVPPPVTKARCLRRVVWPRKYCGGPLRLHVPWQVQVQAVGYSKCTAPYNVQRLIW